jgi:hypothetical protein
MPYLTAINAPRGTIDGVWDVIGCKYLRQIEQAGALAANRALKHLRDSLKAPPDVAVKWLLSQEWRRG